MITKDRFEELKKEKAFIFYLLNNSISIIRLDDTYDISVEEYNKINNCKPTLYHNRNGIFQDICEIDKVFETKEDAEFALRFKRIPKPVEYLDLPTWEEFNKENKVVVFTSYSYKYHLLKVGNYIYLRSFYRYGGMDVYCKPLTKENYFKVCEICRKLWSGEEV